jgi:diguanylate cyclase (GGDEF) domain
VTISLKNTISIKIQYPICAFAFSILTGVIAVQSIKLNYFNNLISFYKKQASTDKLTELHNRSYLDPFLENEINIADKLNKQISVIMIDMDHFKDINDKYGHIVGDHVLTIFAQIVLNCIRKTDKIARYGGDEFIVVLPNTDTATAHFVAERIRQEVSTAFIPPMDGIIISSISCSVGVSTYPVLCSNRNNLVKTSDLALYEAKHAGRNCTIVYNGNLTHAC